MSEEKMSSWSKGALAARGIEDDVIAAGQFNPRGQSGGLFVGGMVGGDAGSALGGAAEGVGLAAGSLAGRHAAGAASGLPDKMLVGVSATTVYGLPRRPGTTSPRRSPFRFRVRASARRSTSWFTFACSS